MAASTRIAVALLVTLLTLVASACTTKRRTSVPPPTAAPIRHVLSNGVRVIIEEHRASDVVAAQLWVKAGGRDEAANELGLAHYLEHMLFKGTPTRPGRLIDREVEGTGGRMNAGTSLDFTYYHMVLPAGRAARRAARRPPPGGGGGALAGAARRRSQTTCRGAAAARDAGLSDDGLDGAQARSRRHSGAGPRGGDPRSEARVEADRGAA